MTHYLLELGTLRVACGAEKAGHAITWSPRVGDVSCPKCAALLRVCREQRL